MSEVHIHEHASPIKNVKQLIVVVVLAFLVPIALCVTIAQLVMRGDKVAGTPAMSDAEVAKRLQPVGKVVVADAKGPKTEKSGKEVVEANCAACHVTGALNAPKIGDNAAWAKLIAEGLETITADAIKGIRQMPPRGGNAALTDTEVMRAVVYMANQSGANWKEPEAKPAAAAPAARSGEQIVQMQCMKCHQTGEGGAPKIGDRAAWIPRVKRGLDPVVQAAIGGHDNMPARGGRADLTDAEFRSAVVYMFQAGGAQPAPTAAAPPATAPATATVTADAGKGKAIYDSTCGVCHAAGVAGAPKTGDKAAWAPRLAGGVDALYASSLKGKNAMPPKGGNLALGEAEVKAAVDYMVGLAR
jgi:cytochrome c5